MKIYPRHCQGGPAEYQMWLHGSQGNGQRLGGPGWFFLSCTGEGKGHEVE